MVTEAEALQIDDQFYQAFRDLNLDAMIACWRGGTLDQCIHPGWPPLRGWQAIAQSWRDIFVSAGFLRIEATDRVVRQLGAHFMVSGLEEIYTVLPGGTSQARVASTRIYELSEDGWKLILHHGSPVSQTMARSGPTDH